MDAAPITAIAGPDAERLSARATCEAQMHPARVRSIAEFVDHLIKPYPRTLYRQADLIGRPKRLADEVSREAELVARTRASPDLPVERRTAVPAGNLQGCSQYPPDLIQASGETHEVASHPNRRTIREPKALCGLGPSQHCKAEVR